MFRLEPKTFMGTRWRNWSSPDICVDLSHYSAGCTIPMHGHVNAFFCFVLAGTTEECASGRREALRPGSLVYHPTGFEHSGQWHEKGRCMHIEFSPRFCEGADRFRLSDPISLSLGERARNVTRRIHDELLHIDSASRIALEGLVLLLLAETIREANSESRVSRWLRRVRDRLQDEFIIVPSLSQIAADVGVHPTYLASSFQQHFGVSIGEFIRLRRIDRAREILSHSDRPLSEVALQLGFSDQSHFSRTFKKQTGLSPLEYRRLFIDNPNPIPNP